MAIGKLTARAVETTKVVGRHSDGGGLYLHVKPTGAKSWAFISAAGGKRREFGLGPLSAVPLAEARRKAQEVREAMARGENPLEKIRPQAAAKIPTFGDCADQLIEAMELGWRNEKHRAQWRVTLGATPYDRSKIRIDAKAHATHVRALAALRAKPVNEIDTPDVMAVLKPLWLVAPETASRLRGRIEKVLDAAKVEKHRVGENPAAWRGHLDNLLPKQQKLTRGHHAAMRFEDMPKFMASLRKRDSISARCLEFLILTAARSGEAIGATWNEIDLDAAVWTIPAERMKAGKAHRVPLSEKALAIVSSLHQNRTSEFVFPGRGKKPMSNMALAMLLRDMVDNVTVHGFRSAFRDWCGEVTHFPRDVAEAALAHRVGDSTEAAYRRGDALEKRRTMMAAWAAHCEPKFDNVVSLASVS